MEENENDPEVLTEKEVNDRQGESVEQRFQRVEMIPVESSNLAAVGYYIARLSGISWLFRDLFIEFKSGSTYHYSDVSEEVYKGLMQAASKGKFFSQTIKNSYSFQKLSS